MLEQRRSRGDNRDEAKEKLFYNQWTKFSNAKTSLGYERYQEKFSQEMTKEDGQGYIKKDSAIKNNPQIVDHQAFDPEQKLGATSKS